MSTKFTLNEAAVSSGKMNKLSIPHYTTADRTALTSTDVEVGSIVYDKDENLYYKVTAVSPVTFVSLGSTLNLGDIPLVLEYPDTGWELALDHFTRGTIADYTVIGASNWTFDTSSTDEFYRHAVKASVSLAVSTNGGLVTTKYSVWYAKRDAVISLTTIATLEMRYKLGLRNANALHWAGLNDFSTDPNASTTQKACVFENNANFLLRTSDGTTQSDLDSATAGDTSVHIHKITWNASQFEYFIDGVSKGTKTTNRPTKPLNPFVNCRSSSGSQTFNDILDYWNTSIE